MAKNQTLTKEQRESFATLLADQRWRLNNLYWVIDKRGREVPFRMNSAQEYLYNNLWYMSVILKARQRGISTFVLIFFLDACLFNKNVQAGFVAHNKDDAEYIFENKAKFAWENLAKDDPPMRDFLLQHLSANTDTANELKFSTGSCLRVATSLRSGTYQYVHVSEFGKICAKYPDKAEEIVSGTFNAVHAGQFVFVESTAEGRTGHFYRLCQEARKLAYSQKKPSALDWKFFFFDWQGDPEYVLEDEQVITPEWKEYFDSVEAQTGIKMHQHQKNWYIAKARTMGDKMKQEFPSTPEEAFEKNLQGSYYAPQMRQIRKDRRICKIPIEPSIPVVTSWDIGMDDTTNIIFCQINGKEKRIIDYYQNNSEGLTHYVRILKEKGYIYGCHFLPHDISVRELGTGKSRLEVLRGLLPTERVIIVPRLPIADGIEAVRNLLASCWFDEERTATLVTALDEYRKEWNEKQEVYREKPLHNWASNPADAMRILATVIDTYYTPTNINYGKHLDYNDYEEDTGRYYERDTFNSVTGY